MSTALRPPGLGWFLVGAGAIVLVVGLPAIGLVESLVRVPSQLGLSSLQRAVPLLRDSVLLSLAVAATASVLGTWLAWAASRLRYPGRRWLAVFALLPLATPSYLLAASAERVLFSPVAPLSALGGLPAAWIVLSVVTTPVVQLVVSASLARSSASEEEAARSLGAGRVRLWQVVVLPRVRAAVAFGFVLAFVYALSDFGAVAVLDVPVLTFRLYQAVAAHDLSTATLYGGLLLGAGLPTLLLAGWLRGRGAAGVANPRSPARLRAGPIEVALSVGAQIVLGGVGVALPVIELSRWVLEGIVDARRDFAPLAEPLAQSVTLAAVGALVTVALAFAPSWVAARGRGGWLRQAAWLASALPGPLLAFGWILIALLLGRAGLLSYGVVSSTGALLVLGYATRFLAEASAPLEDGILHLDPRQEAAARTLGASRVRWAVRIVGPALRPAVVASFALAFIAILKELPVTLLLGGPAGVNTLAFRIFDRYNEALFHDAGLAGLLLLVATLLALTLTLRRT